MAVQVTTLSPNWNSVVAIGPSFSTTSSELQDTVTRGSASVTLMPSGTVPGVFTCALPSSESAS